MVNIQESAVKPSKKPHFKTVFYKGVELFTHRDPCQNRKRLCLYDAESGWMIASGVTRSEGRTEEELLQILESKLTQANQRGESFKNLISRLRRESPPKEEQKAIRKAYVEAMATSRESKAARPVAKRGGMQPPVNNSTTKVAVPGDHQPRREVIKMPEIQNLKHRCNLVLHCGASAVKRVDVARVSTPQPTQTWQPIPHVSLLEEVESALRSTGLKIGNQVHSLNADGNRYFGLTEVHGPGDARDYALVLGLRNSHDKTFPVGLVAGASVFVCDNLSFSGEVRLTRKHTVHLQRDLPQLVAGGVGKLMQLWNHQGQRIDTYKNYRMRDKTALDLVIRASDVGACTNRMIPAIIKEWREPSHPEFKDRTGWSLFNAFTEVLKGNLPELSKRTTALHALFDTQVKLPAAHLN
jgi:hypothetical protein